MVSVHFQQQLLLESSALDNFQKDSCCFAGVLLPYKNATQKRYNQCITPAHIVAYLAHPKYKDEKLTSAEEELALEWLKNIEDDYVIPLLT